MGYIMITGQWSHMWVVSPVKNQFSTSLTPAELGVVVVIVDNTGDRSDHGGSHVVNLTRASWDTTLIVSWVTGLHSHQTSSLIVFH